VNTRLRNVDGLRHEEFDVLILGGGINGAGVARDLALRARTAGTKLAIALVDQNHFASGTSSRNSHLIHGGLRYLKQFAIHLVRESLRERAVLLEIAPHLVEPQPFLLPLASVYKSLYYATGLTMYDALDRTGALPHHRWLSRAEVHKLEPGLAPGMRRAAEYYDCQVRSARLVLENIFEAIANGATCVNYVRATSYERAGQTWRVKLEDRVTRATVEARAKLLIDATGPWAHDPAPRLVRGSHIVMPRLNASGHAIAFFDDAGRIVFFIPWGERGDCTLVGTTDVDHNADPNRVAASAEEAAYLRRIAARVFPESEKLEPVATFSSLRPLLAASPAAAKGSPTHASREHRIFFDPRGVLRITGGKYTTYRAMSEQAADLALEQVAPALKSIHVTAHTPVSGNSKQAIAALRSEAPALASRAGLTPADILFLIHQYGVQTPAVVECICSQPSNTEASTRLTAGRLQWAIQHEMAVQPADFLEVSTTLGHEGHRDIMTPTLEPLPTP
jgi:glycerol-3-phosphate dehydrogenase